MIELAIKNKPKEHGLLKYFPLQMIELAIKNKPKEHGLLKYFPRKCVPQMNRIGG